VLARLLAALDRRVGAGRYTVVLTSDHGGAALPEQAATARRLPGVSAPVRMARDAETAQAIEQAVTRAVGAGFHVAIQHPYVWVRGDGAAAARMPAALAAARTALRALPGVERVLAAADLVHLAPGDELAQA